jgi:NAD(P)-dependent dehydrogenase (short-subunit alcohol dehydrogenase family)
VLEGRRILVTGASSGIGRAVAELCVSHGARVLATGRRADALEELDGVRRFACDLLEPGAPEACVAECVEFTDKSPTQQFFRNLLFSRIVPCVKDIGLWGAKVQHAYVDLGVMDAADSDLDALMAADEDVADRMEREHAVELAARKQEGGAAIAAGSAG